MEGMNDKIDYEVKKNFYISKSSTFNKKKETPENITLTDALKALSKNPNQWVVEVLNETDEFIHPYFDVDIKNKNQEDDDQVIEEMTKFYELIDKFMLGGFTINYYQEGTDREPYNPEYPYIQIPEEVTLANSENVTIKNKFYSAHVYISGQLVKRSEFNEQMKRIFGNSEIIDYHIYTTGHKIFRHPYSPKPCDNKGLRINTSIETLKNIFGDGLNFTIHSSEKNPLEVVGSLDFLDEIEPVNNKKTIRSCGTCNAIRTTTTTEAHPSITSGSIFLKIFKSDGITWNDLLSSQQDITNYEVSQQFLPFMHMPLTREEFEQELKQLPYYIQYPGEISRLLSQQNIKKYTQTWDIKPLRLLRSKWNNWLKEDNDHGLPTEAKTIMYSVLKRIDFYISKYEQICFAAEKTIYDGKRKTRDDAYGQVCVIEGKFYVKGYGGKLMQSTNDAVRGMFAMSDYKVRDFKGYATFYSSMAEYERLRVQILYEQDSVKYDRDAQVMLKIARRTFSSYDEFVLYFSFIAAKLRKERKQQRLNIVNYGKKDCLKTTLTVMFSDYMIYSMCKIQDINLNFNASMASDLVNIEELPSDTTRRNETFAILKDITANRKIEITKKGLDSVTVENYLNIVISTNEKNCCGMFNRCDWEPMSKRFRVLKREQLKEDELTEFFNAYSDESIFALVKYLKGCDEFQHFEQCQYFKQLTPIQEEIINEEKNNDDINKIREPEVLSEFLAFECKSKIKFIIQPLAKLAGLTVPELKNKFNTTEYITYKPTNRIYTMKTKDFDIFVTEWCEFMDEVKNPKSYIAKYNRFYKGEDIPTDALN